MPETVKEMSGITCKVSVDMYIFMYLGWLSGSPFAFLGDRYTESPRVGIEML
jgi:hypothetical protein